MFFQTHFIRDLPEFFFYASLPTAPKQQLATEFNLKKSVIFSSLHWLEENILINEIKQVETIDFMANPYFVMSNSPRDERIAEWNRRCDIARDKKIATRKRKRLRELKKANQQ